MKKSRGKFVELAEKRVNKTIKDLRLIGNLANKANYDYENIDAKKIVSCLRQELKVLDKKFDDSSTETDREFKL